MGRGPLPSSRPCRVKTTRRSAIWHSEQVKLWCSKPRTASRTTFIKINSAPHAEQWIGRTPINNRLSSAYSLVKHKPWSMGHAVLRYGSLPATNGTSRRTQ